MNGNDTGPKVAVGCGALLLFLAFCVTAFGAFHVFLDRGGAISADEAMPALLGGGMCMFVDVLIVAIGAVMLARGRGGAPGGMPPGAVPPGGTTPSMTPSGTQVMNSGSLPGAPMAGAMPGAGMPSPSGTPWHLLSGCGTLFFVTTFCISLGAIPYFYSEVERWEEHLVEDSTPHYDPYGYGGYGGSSVDDLLVVIDQGAIEENQQYMGASSCCCTFSFLFALAGAAGTYRLIQRRRQGAA
jgi:hypothetical protein